MIELCTLHKYTSLEDMARRVELDASTLDGWRPESCREVILDYFDQYRQTFDTEHPPIKEEDMGTALQAVPVAEGMDGKTKIHMIPRVYPAFIFYYMHHRDRAECDIRHFMKHDRRLALIADSSYMEM